MGVGGPACYTRVFRWATVMGMRNLSLGWKYEGNGKGSRAREMKCARNGLDWYFVVQRELAQEHFMEGKRMAPKLQLVTLYSPRLSVPKCANNLRLCNYGSLTEGISTREIKEDTQVCFSGEGFEWQWAGPRVVLEGFLRRFFVFFPSRFFFHFLDVFLQLRCIYLLFFTNSFSWGVLLFPTYSQLP